MDDRTMGRIDVLIRIEEVTDDPRTGIAKGVAFVDLTISKDGEETSLTIREGPVAPIVGVIMGGRGVYDQEEYSRWFRLQYREAVRQAVRHADQISIAHDRISLAVRMPHEEQDLDLPVDFD